MCRRCRSPWPTCGVSCSPWRGSGTPTTLSGCSGGGELESSFFSRCIIHDVSRYVPGRTLYEIDPWTTAHFYQCGEFVAKMDLALASFNHPGRTSGQTALLSLSFSISGYENRNSIWYLNSIPDLKVSIFGDIFRKFPEVKNSPSRCG